MIRNRSQKQLALADFEWPFQVALDENNRWVKLSQCMPWDELAEGYYRSFSADQGCPVKDARLVIGTVILWDLVPGYRRRWLAVFKPIDAVILKAMQPVVKSGSVEIQSPECLSS